jgi:RNA polymerase sigma-70 factor (ECF subfamily)
VGRGADGGELVRAAARGEHRAQEELFVRYWPVLLGYYRAVGWGDVAEDLTMNVWSSLLAGGLRRLEGASERDFRVLLFTVAHRRLVDHQRRGLRRPAVPVAAPMEAGDGPLMSSGPETDPAALVEALQDAEDVVRFLRRVLSPAQAEVVYLRVLDGFTVGEIATIVDRSPNAVSMLCARALTRLGEALSVQEAGDL